MTERDFNEFKASIPTVRRAVPERSTFAAASVSDKTREVRIGATLLCAQDVLADGGAEISEGQFFDIDDGKYGHAVIVISQPRANELFPGEKVIDKTVILNDREFKIIGVLAKPDFALQGVALADVYMDLNSQLEPSTIQPVLSKGILPPTLPLDRIWIKVGDLIEVKPTDEIIQNVLARNHLEIRYSIRSGYDMRLDQGD